MARRKRGYEKKKKPYYYEDLTEPWAKYHIDKIRINKTDDGEEFRFRVNGHFASLKWVAKLFNVSQEKVSKLVEHHGIGNPIKISRELNEILIRERFRLPTNCTIYWRGKDAVWPNLVTRITGLRSSSVIMRCRGWMIGAYDCDELFSPFKKERGKFQTVFLERYENPWFKCRRGDNGRWLFEIMKGRERGKVYLAKEFCKKFNLVYSGLLNAINKYGVNTLLFYLYIDNTIWRAENNLHISIPVYVKHTGEKCAIPLVLRKCPMITEHEAKLRIYAWLKDNLTSRQLFQKEPFFDVKKQFMEGEEEATESFESLADLSDKPRPCPKFTPTKWDKMFAGKSVQPCGAVTIKTVSY